MQAGAIPILESCVCDHPSSTDQLHDVVGMALPLSNRAVREGVVDGVDQGIAAYAFALMFEEDFEDVEHLTTFRQVERFCVEKEGGSCEFDFHLPLLQ